MFFTPEITQGAVDVEASCRNMEIEFDRLALLFGASLDLIGFIGFGLAIFALVRLIADAIRVE